MLRCDWLGFFTAVIGAFRSSMSLSCFLGSPMSCGLFFFVFLVGIHASGILIYSNVPVDVFRVTSYVNCHFDLASVPVRVTFNKLNLISKRLCCGLALKRRRSGHGLVGCLGRAPLFLHWLSSLVAVNFTVFTINGVFRSY